MNPVSIAVATSVCVFAGAFFGLQMHRILPEGHQTKETQDVVRLGIGMLSVLASLVLGLLISTAKSSYDNTDHSTRAFAADLILLSEVLRDFGGEASVPRDLLRDFTVKTIKDTWPQDAKNQRVDNLAAGTMLEHVREQIRALRSVDAAQKTLQDQALQIHLGLAKQRWQIIEQKGPTIQPMVLGILVSWITCIFASFGLNAPRNGTVVTAFLICAVAIGTAVFMILAMDSPMSGPMQITSAPMYVALSHMSW